MIGHFETAWAIGQRSGKGAFHMTKKFALEQGIRDSTAVHLDQRSPLARAPVMNCASNQFLARPAFTGNQDCRVGRSDQFHLPQDMLQRLALADEFSHPQGSGDFFSQIEVLFFQASTKEIDLFIRFGIRNAHRRVIREDPQPFEGFLVEQAPVEEPQDSENLVPVGQGLRGEGPHFLACKPSRVRHPLFVALQPGQPNGLSGRSHTPDFSFSQWKSMKGTVEAAVVGLRITGNAGTGDEVQGSVAFGGILPTLAHVAESVRFDQPDARQNRVGALGDTVSDGSEHVLKAALLSRRDH